MILKGLQQPRFLRKVAMVTRPVECHYLLYKPLGYDGRATGFFDIRTKQGRIQGISHRFCTTLHHVDGYSYQKGTAHADHSSPSAR